jgi:tetratricopeptide (TPR) repeat protein
MKKIFFFLILTVFGIFLYYFLSDSYRYSLEAKAYYEMGEYERAYKIAQKAYDIDKYNRMAFTIVTQSKISMIWDKFIKDSEDYFKKIDEISNKETITKADKIKIKMMLEIIMGEYKNLPHSKLINKDLEKKAQEQYKKAEELYNGIFKK